CTAGNSPAACREASELTPSDNTQILIPAPVTPVFCTMLAPWATTASDIVVPNPTLVCTPFPPSALPSFSRIMSDRVSDDESCGGMILLVVATSAGRMLFTEGTAASVSRTVTGRLARTVLYAGKDEITLPPSDWIGPANAVASVVSISTSTRPSAP